jgi:hypothetical protein
MEPTECFANDQDLAALNVPDNVREYIAAQTYPRAWRTSYTGLRVLVVALVFAVPGACAVALFRACAWLETRRAELGYFSAENHGWSFLILLFGLLLAAVWAPLAWPGLRKSRFAEYVGVRALFEKARSARKGTSVGIYDKGLLVAILPELIRAYIERRRSRGAATDPASYLRYQSRASTSLFVWPAVVFIAAGAIALPLDLGAYDVGTRTGLERHSALGDSLIQWSALTRVQFACADERQASPFTLYELSFTGGATTSALLHPTAEAVARLSEFDSTIRASGVPVEVARYRGGTNVGKPVWTAGCPERVAAKTGADVARLKRLFSPSPR